MNKPIIRTVARSVMIEPLEGRLLLSSSVGDHVLYIIGTPRKDVITIIPSGKNLKLNDNGLITTYPQRGIRSIYVRLDGGNDRFQVLKARGKRQFTLRSDIQAGPGNDTVIGGWGKDVIYGGVGYDSIMGGDGPDSIFGQEHNDIVIGGKGNDEIYGFRGNDTLIGDAGRDSLYAGTQDDMLDGGRDDDLVVGETGQDRLLGGAGNDWLCGEDGQDTFYTSDAYEEIKDLQAEETIVAPPTRRR